MPSILIAVSCVLSLLVEAFIYPNHFVWINRSFLDSADAGVPFAHTFVLANQLLNGGVQLFDRYDQFSYVYGHMSAGIYAIDNILTACLYFLISPFTHDQPQLFHWCFSIFFYVLTTIIRAIGGYLLLTLFIKDKLAILISLVYLNTFLSSITMIEGHIAQTSFSFLPLLVYFIVRFFQQWRFNDFLAALLMMIAVVCNQPLFGLGYFYVVVHFVIMAGLLCSVCIPSLRSRMLGCFKQPTVKAWLKLLAVVVLGGVMLWPTVMMAQALNTDFFIANSGFGGTSGRLGNAFKPLNYFIIDGKSFTNPLAFFVESVDFKHYVWGSVHWIFIGVSVLVFALIGYVLSRDVKKHIFFLAIIAVILLNVAAHPNNLYALAWYINGILKDPAAAFQQGLHLEQVPLLFLLMVSSIVHWINALTNPFSFLLRTFHVPAVFMPYLFLPLIALGVSACLDLIRGHQDNIYRQRLPWVLGLLLALMVISAYCLPEDLRLYVSAVIALYVIFISLVLFAKGLPRPKVIIAFGLLVLIMGIDLAALNAYARAYPRDNRIRETLISNLPDNQAAVIEYQNPKTMAFREFSRIEPLPPMLSCDESYCGAFFQVTPLERNLRPSSIYTPIPTAYKDLHEDAWTKFYLERQPRLIDFRDAALDEQLVGMGDLVVNHVEGRALLVDGSKVRDYLVDPAQLALPPSTAGDVWREFKFDLAKASLRHQDGKAIYHVKLPNDFPEYLSTTVLTPDYYSWELSVGNQPLKPVQGRLTDPFTFDVGNVHHHYLTIALPGGFNAGDDNALLRVKMPRYITDVWRNEHDQIGFNFQAPHHGWVIFHYPYDPKWQLSVDGQPAKLVRVNKYFMGTPLTQGEHRILMQYWPNTLLRWFIIISVLLNLIVVEGLIIYAFASKQKNGRVV